MDKKVYNIFDFEISDIVCEQTLFKNTLNKIKKDLTSNTDANILCDIKVDKRNKSLIILLGIIISTKEDKINIIEIHYSFYFRLKKAENYDEKLIDKIDINLGRSLLGVSYSTFRGLCFKEFKNSQYSDISPLPIINPAILYDMMLKGENKTKKETSINSKKKNKKSQA